MASIKGGGLLLLTGMALAVWLFSRKNSPPLITATVSQNPGSFLIQGKAYASDAPADIQVIMDAYYQASGQVIQQENVRNTLGSGGFFTFAWNVVTSSPTGLKIRISADNKLDGRRQTLDFGPF